MTIRRKSSQETDEARLDDGAATQRVREVQNEAVVSRRGVLWRAGLATAIGAAGLTALDQQRADAATGGSFLLGNLNDAGSVTSLKTSAGLTTGISQLMSLDGSTNVTVSTLDVTGPAGGSAVVGHVTAGGTGVTGSSSSNGVGVAGSSASGSGVSGSSTSGSGVSGSSGTGVGVVGSSASNHAVHGTATANGKAGVLGTDNSVSGGAGVYGASTKGTGVLAYSASGTALSVSGKVHFSRSGSASFAKGTKTKNVAVAGLTSGSLVLVTLQKNATGVFITSAVPASGKFTVHLSKAAPSSMRFAWFVLAG